MTEKLIGQHRSENIVFVRMDINRFRLINAYWGETGGDELLKFIGEQIRLAVSEYDWSSYGRIESDVFCFCIPYEKEKCENSLQLLIRKIGEYNTRYLIEPSFGLYVVEDFQLSCENMFMYATLAAKACKGKYMKYSDFYNEKVSDNLMIEQEITQDMQRALENEEFIPYFQPKYNTKTRRPYGAEALVRWKHPEKGMISPGVFIPAFEKNGFIGNLDYYIWGKVCQHIRKWIDEGIEVTPISVNMSRVELSNPNLVGMLTGLIHKYKIEPKYLQLELTESAYIDNPEFMDNTIKHLHGAGFVVLMDDFGSGYSSLNTLKDISVDILKIDMKFLSADEANVKSKKILASVITMAQWIGIPVITEGVETEEQYEFLKKLGCEYIQGYYFAKPMAPLDYQDLITH